MMLCFSEGVRSSLSDAVLLCRSLAMVVSDDCRTALAVSNQSERLKGRLDEVIVHKAHSTWKQTKP